MILTKEDEFAWRNMTRWMRQRATVTAALRKVSEASDQRDAFITSNYVAVGGAHHVTMATQGLNVYERMEFDRS